LNLFFATHVEKNNAYMHYTRFLAAAHHPVAIFHKFLRLISTYFECFRVAHYTHKSNTHCGWSYLLHV